MTRSLYAALGVLALMGSPPGRAQTNASITIDPMPEPQAKSAAHPALVRAVRTWNEARQREAQACAKGVAGPGNMQMMAGELPLYNSHITLHWDTPSVFALEWRQTSNCPVHGTGAGRAPNGVVFDATSDVHVEGIAFDATTGERYDVRRLYPGPLQKHYFDQLLDDPEASGLDADCVTRLRAYRRRAPQFEFRYVVLGVHGLMIDPETPDPQDPVVDCLQVATLPYPSIRDVLDPKEAARLRWNP